MDQDCTTLKYDRKYLVVINNML